MAPGISLHTSVFDCALMMKELKLSALGVIDDSKLIGIVSENDIVRKVVGSMNRHDMDIKKLTVASIMTKNPTFVLSEGVGPKHRKQEDEKALKIMAQGNFRHVPICNANGQYIRMVDIVEAAEAYMSGSVGFLERLSKTAMKLLKIQRKASTATRGSDGNQNIRKSAGNITLPVYLSVTATISQTAMHMASHRKSALLIVTGMGTVTGIVSESDIIRRVIARDLDPEKTLVSEIMTPNPKSVAHGTDPKDALNEMIKSKFRHIPILAQDGVNYETVLDILNVVRASMNLQVNNSDSTTTIHLEKGESKLGTPISKLGKSLLSESTEGYLKSSSKNEISELNRTLNESSNNNNLATPIQTETTFSLSRKDTIEGTPLDMDTSTPKANIKRELFHELNAMRKIQESDFDGAIKEYTLALERCVTGSQSVDYGRVLVRRGTALSAVGKLIDALADFEQGLAILESYRDMDLIDEILVNMAEVQVDLDRFEDAKESLNQLAVPSRGLEIFAILSEDCNKLRERGKEAFQKEEISESMNFFTSALRIHRCLEGVPEYEKEYNKLGAILHCNRAATYIKFDDVPHALEDCFLAIKFDPEYTRAFERLGTCYEKFGKTSSWDVCYKNAMKKTKFHHCEKGLCKVSELEKTLFVIVNNNHEDKNNPINKNAKENDKENSANVNVAKIKDLGKLFAQASTHHHQQQQHV